MRCMYVCDFRTWPTAVYRVGRSVCPAAILLQLCHGTVREKMGSAGGQIYGGVQPNLSQSSAPNRKPNISSKVPASQGTRQLARRYTTIAFQITIHQNPKHFKNSLCPSDCSSDATSRETSPDTDDDDDDEVDDDDDEVDANGGGGDEDDEFAKEEQSNLLATEIELLNQLTLSQTTRNKEDLSEAYSKLFHEFSRNALPPVVVRAGGEAGGGGGGRRTYLHHANRTKGLAPFVKVPYPDLIDAGSQKGLREPLLDKNYGACRYLFFQYLPLISKINVQMVLCSLRKCVLWG